MKTENVYAKVVAFKTPLKANMIIYYELLKQRSCISNLDYLI